jgi:uncharacterized Fe-S cluster-containing radical SAM superfamily enzyme
MPIFEFKDIAFEEEKDKVRLIFLRIFYTYIGKDELREIGNFRISEHSVEFPDTKENYAAKKFNALLLKSFSNLTNSITKKKTVYIHQNSGIPLIGNSYIGLIDRNTSIIELRIITGCNLDCIYCSVDQNVRPVDFVVEKDYLVSEFKKLVKHKGINDIEAHIGTQGEPLFYEPLAELIHDLSQIEEVGMISVDTNGTILTKTKVDELVNSGLKRFNFSINAVDAKLAEEIAGCRYNIQHILDILHYIASKKVKLIITPVWIPGINDKEIPKLIELSKELKCDIGIQNFLEYEFGKNPAKEMQWEEFIEKMKKLEKDHNLKLLFDFKKDFNIRATKPLPKPFQKGDIIKARIVCPGRLKAETLAVADDRNISVHGYGGEFGKTVKLKITREKHNIFYGILIN